MTISHGAEGAALECNKINLRCDPARQTNWGAVSATSAGDNDVVLRSVSCKGFISRHGFRVVLVAAGAPISGQLAELLGERVASPGCQFLPVLANFASLGGV